MYSRGGSRGRLAAIARFDPKLNAVLEVLSRRERRRRGGVAPDAPFAGVPFLIKELALHAAMQPCRMGSRLADAACRFRPTPN